MPKELKVANREVKPAIPTVPTVSVSLPPKKLLLPKIKVAILGDNGVGKKTLICRLAKKESLDEYYYYYGLAVTSRELSNGEKLRIELCGENRYQTNTWTCPKSDVVIIVVDITRRGTFSSLNERLEEIKRNSPDAIKILVFNKAGLKHKRAISDEEGLDFANKNGMHFYSTDVYSVDVKKVTCVKISKDGKRDENQHINSIIDDAVDNLSLTISKKLQPIYSGRLIEELEGKISSLMEENSNAIRRFFTAINPYNKTNKIVAINILLGELKSESFSKDGITSLDSLKRLQPLAKVLLDGRTGIIIKKAYSDLHECLVDLKNNKINFTQPDSSSTIQLI